MSAGHHVHTDHPRLGEHEVDQVLKNPQIRARLARTPKISFAYDIPWLAGYSEDGSTVYIDRHIPARALPIHNRTVNVLPCLIAHEMMEKAVIDVLKKHYDYAHEIASRYEDRVVRQQGFLPKPYNEWLAPYIKSDEIEKLKKVPPDLDLTPYIDSHAIYLLMHLRQAMGKS